MVAICLALNSAPSPCIQKARGDEHGSPPDLSGQPLSTVWVPQLHALPISSQPCRHLHCEAILYSTSYKYTLCWYRDDTFYITYILEWNLSMVTPMIFKKSLKRPLICVLVLLVPVWSPKRDHLPPPCDRYGQDFLYGYRWSIFFVFLQLYKHYTEDDPPPPVQFLQTPHLLGLYGEYFMFVNFREWTHYSNMTVLLLCLFRAPGPGVLQARVSHQQRPQGEVPPHPGLCLQRVRQWRWREVNHTVIYSCKQSCYTV